MRPVDAALLDGPAPDVAPGLLGRILRHGSTSGRITEVEAYTPDDPASHSFRGRTGRNGAMFGPPGRLYVYLIYGVHHCANVVVGPEGHGAAVLIRAIEPVAGEEVMRRRRRGRSPVAVGPGRLCQALDIDRRHDDTDLLAGGPIELLDDGAGPPAEIRNGVRIGLSVGADTPWRWWVDRTPSVRSSAGRGPLTPRSGHGTSGF